MSLDGYNAFLKRNQLDRKTYQEEGIEWCLNIETDGKRLGDQLIHSAILADEMGLGKTIQMLGLIISNFKMHTMIVLPRALLEQWDSIIAKFLGHDALVYHGPKAKTITVEDLKTSPIVLTTYGMLAKVVEKPRKNMPLKFGKLHKVKWDRIIFDEAHHMRNRNTRNHKAGAAVKATHKWLVTGTPIQNSVNDFYGLCAVLGIDQRFYTNKGNIHVISEALILKRTKKCVGIVLPDMRRHVINVPWESDEERLFAEDIHAHLTFARVHMRQANLFGGGQIHPFAMLQRARQACIDMTLLQKNIQVLINLGIIEDESLFESALQYQSKINAVISKIEERKENGRAKLVFCHYHGEIDKIKQQLLVLGLNTTTFDGRTSQTQRDEILESDEYDAIVLQIRTGCEGLNLQRFSEVYFVTPNWNPAVEDQAVARCHRIGQESEIDVFSFRMESFDEDNNTRTLDVYVRNVQIQKRHDAKILDIHEEGDCGAEIGEDCSICLCAQHEHDHTKLECGHCFHTKCIQGWFQHGTGCPLCRR